MWNVLRPGAPPPRGPWLLRPALALVAAACGKPAPAPTPVHDFGRVAEGEVLEHDFTFVNRSPEPCRILRLRASCDCTLPRGTQQVLEPGTAAPIRVRVDTLELDGPWRGTVRVFTDHSGDTAAAEFVMTMEVERRVRAVPRHLVLQAPRSAGAVVEVGLEADQDAFQVVDVAATDARLEVHHEPGRRSFQVVLPPGLPHRVQTLEAEVVATLEGSPQSWVRIPVVATVLPDTVFEPDDALTFGTIDPDLGAGRTLVVRSHHPTRELRLEEATVVTEGGPAAGTVADFLEVETREVDPGREFHVTVRLRPGAPEEPILSRLRVRTNDPDLPEKSLFLWGSVRRGPSGRR